MRRPPRNPFHHSDLGGAFLAFAPKFSDDDQDVTRGPLSDDHLPYSTRHQRSSILSLLIDALRYRRHRAVAPPAAAIPAKPDAGKDS
jgi:hypothetical protein